MTLQLAHDSLVGFANQFDSHITKSSQIFRFLWSVIAGFLLHNSTVWDLTVIFLSFHPRIMRYALLQKPDLLSLISAICLHISSYQGLFFVDNMIWLIGEMCVLATFLFDPFSFWVYPTTKKLSTFIPPRLWSTLLIRGIIKSNKWKQWSI